MLCVIKNIKPCIIKSLLVGKVAISNVYFEIKQGAKVISSSYFHHKPFNYCKTVTGNNTV